MHFQLVDGYGTSKFPKLDWGSNPIGPVEIAEAEALKKIEKAKAAANQLIASPGSRKVKTRATKLEALAAARALAEAAAHEALDMEEDDEIEVD